MTLRGRCLPCLLLVATACGGRTRTVPISNHGGDPPADPVAVEWNAAPDPDPAAEQARITIVVDGSAVALGSLSTEADGDDDGTLQACRIRSDLAKPTTTGFEGGGSPAYDYLVTSLTGPELVVTLVTGVGPEPSDEKRTVVKRIPVTGTRLTVAPWTPPPPPPTR